jgi:hypothetical protein
MFCDRSNHFSLVTSCTLDLDDDSGVKEEGRTARRKVRPSEKYIQLGALLMTPIRCQSGKKNGRSYARCDIVPSSIIIIVITRIECCCCCRRHKHRMNVNLDHSGKVVVVVVIIVVGGI